MVQRKKKIVLSAEETVTCPNCGSLLPVGSDTCFVCDYDVTPKGGEKEGAEGSEVSPEGEATREDEPEGVGEEPSEVTEAVEPAEEGEELPASAAEEDEAVDSEEVEEVDEDGADEVEEETEVDEEGAEKVGAGRSYRGLAIAATGGLIYSLVLLVFVPILGTFVSAVILAIGAIMIVFGGNMAVKDFASTAPKVKKISCPLCDQIIPGNLKECPNCGAIFSE